MTADQKFAFNTIINQMTANLEEMTLTLATVESCEYVLVEKETGLCFNGMNKPPVAAHRAESYYKRTAESLCDHLYRAGETVPMDMEVVQRTVAIERLIEGVKETIRMIKSQME